MKALQKPRGTQDILPADQKYWFKVEDSFRETMLSSGFGRIIVPTFEDTALFVRGVGEMTDIVGKEMYTFKDRSDNSLTLRPEFTASVVRAYIEHGMHKEPQPVKLFYFGPVYRYDRPQAGRYREFYQAGAELFGELDPGTDAQLISSMMGFFATLGLKDLTVKINSIGDIKNRIKINKALIDFLTAHRRTLCNDCRKRMIKNPLRALDCKEKSCQPVMEEAGSVLLDNLNPESKTYFTKVLEYLDELHINYELTPRLVRGLDYYTHTVFEIFDGKSESALGGGGRYDGLVKILGGPDTPAVGFALGIERIIELMKSRSVEVAESTNCDVFVVQLGDEAKKKAMRVIAELQEAGYKVGQTLGRESIGSQLKVADRMGATLAVIIGETEVHDKGVIVRDLSDRTQEPVGDKSMLSVVARKVVHGVRKHT